MSTSGETLDLFPHLNDPAKVKQLLEQGADPNMFGDRGNLPVLHKAVSSLAYETVKLLIEKGANVNIREGDVWRDGILVYGGNGNTALAEAATQQSPRMTELLIAGGADVNAASQGGYTPLLVAAGRGNTQVVKALLDAGADINAEGNDKQSALSKASSRGYYETADLLRKYLQK